jgi:hypothetical protein
MLNTNTTGTIATTLETPTPIQEKRNAFLRTGSMLTECREAFKRMSWGAQLSLCEWDGFAKKVAGVGRSQADRIIAAYTAYENILDGYIKANGGCVPLEDDGFEMPYSEYQLRSLVSLNYNGLLQYDAWARALEIAKENDEIQPTSYMVAWAVEGILDEREAKLQARLAEIKADRERVMQDPNRLDPFVVGRCESWDPGCIDCRDCADDLADCVR